MAPVELVHGPTGHGPVLAEGVSLLVHCVALALGLAVTTVLKSKPKLFCGAAWACVGFCASLGVDQPGPIQPDTFSMMMAIVAGYSGYIWHRAMMKLLAGLVAALVAAALLRFRGEPLASTSTVGSTTLPTYELVVVFSFVLMSLGAFVAGDLLEGALVHFNAAHVGVLSVLSGGTYFMEYIGTDMQDFSFLDSMSRVLAASRSGAGTGRTLGSDCGDFCKVGILSWNLVSWAMLGLICVRAGSSRRNEYTQLPKGAVPDHDEEMGYDEPSPSSARDWGGKAQGRAPARSPDASPRASAASSPRGDGADRRELKRTPGGAAGGFEPAPAVPPLGRSRTAPARAGSPPPGGESAPRLPRSSSGPNVSKRDASPRASPRASTKGGSSSSSDDKDEGGNQEDERWVAERMARWAKWSKKQQTKRELRTPEQQTRGENDLETPQQWVDFRIAKLREELQGLESMEPKERRAKLRVLQRELHPDKQPPEMRAHAQSLFLLVQKEWKLYN